MEQRRQTDQTEVELRAVGGLLVGRTYVLDDSDRVAQDVLVTMDRIVLQPHRGEFGQELVGEAGVVEKPQARRRMVDRHQLVELDADPLSRHDLEPRCHLLHCGDELLRGGEVVPGDEPGSAQHPQRIVAEAHLGSQRCAQVLLHQIDGTTVRIDQRRRGSTGQLERHRIDREIPAAEIGLDVVGVDDVRLPRVVGVRLRPERGDLVSALAEFGADRAEPLTLRPQRIGPARQTGLDVVGACIGGEIEVDVVTTRVDEQVAHDATDEVQAMAGVGEARRQRRQLGEHGSEAIRDHGEARLGAFDTDPGHHGPRRSATLSAGGSHRDPLRSYARRSQRHPSTVTHVNGSAVRTAGGATRGWRMRQWPNDATVVHLIFVDHLEIPSRDAIDAAVEHAHRKGARAIRTSALFPRAAEQLLAAEFHPIDRLALLRQHLDDDVIARLPTAGRTGPFLPWLAAGAARVDQDAFGPMWGNSADSLRDIRRATPQHRARLVRRDRRVAGIAISGAAGTAGYLQRLAVATDRRREGVATTLVVDALRWMHRRELTTVMVNTGVTNTAALALYERLGFERLDDQLVIAERRLIG